MTAGTPAQSNGKSNVFTDLVGQLVEATKLVDDLRDLLRHGDDGGSAAFMRLAGEDPMDYDPHARPVLSVAVADVERLLDGLVLLRVMVIDPKDFVAGDTGSGKYGRPVDPDQT